MRPFRKKSTLFNVAFSMRNGTVVRTSGVEEVTVKQDPHTTEFTSYSIRWATGKAPALFALNVKEIIGVTAVKEK